MNVFEKLNQLNITKVDMKKNSNIYFVTRQFMFSNRLYKEGEVVYFPLRHLIKMESYMDTSICLTPIEEDVVWS